MTRVDYVAISKVMAAKRPDPKRGTVAEKLLWQGIVEGLKDIMAVNPNFDRDRFQRACEGNDHVERDQQGHHRD